MTLRNSQVFNPPIEPVISSGEIGVYTAMIEGQLEPKNASSLSSTSVVVIGAGLAGLAAARELKKAGADVTILESSDRAGGRCHTLSSPHFDEGIFAEAGGVRIPGTHKIIMKYIDEFGLKKMPFSNMKDESGLLFFDGVRKNIDQELQDPTSTLARVVEKWDESIGPIRFAYSNGSIKWDELTARYCSMSLIDFLHEEEWPEELIEGFAKYGIGLGAYEAILDLSFIEILRLFIVNNYDSKNFQLDGGMESLTNAFLNDDNVPLSSVIKYGYKVASVVQNWNGRYVVSGDTSSSSSKVVVCPTYECDYVIVTVPLPQLRHITFDPPLRGELNNAINDVHYVQAAKIFLQTKSRFWLRHGVDGMLISDLGIQNTYFSPEFSGSSKGLITASYVWENQAEKLFALSQEEKISLAIDELKQVFPEIEDEFERGAAVEWKPGFCVFRPGQAKRYHKVLREEVLPGIYLAGEHCSVEHGYFEGALESGLRAAAGVFRSVDEDFLARFEELSGVTTPKPTTHDARLKAGNQQHLAVVTQTPRKGSLCLDASANPSFRSEKVFGQLKLPVIAKRLDHYTLICSNAKEVAEFHVKCLHFELDSIKPVNKGTVPQGEYDMLNYILRPPANKDMLMVVTEGLNDETIFRKYMKAHGPGVHHFAFEVDDLETTFAAVKEAGIQTTSEKVTMDIISGLKQFFIAPSHAGFFIELIERPRHPVKVDLHDDSARSDHKELFTSNNMAELAQSISRFVKPQSPQSFSQCIGRDEEEEKKQEHMGEEVIADAMAGVDVGKITAIEVAVEDISSSLSFLTEILNFRFIRHTGEKIFIALPGASQDVCIILKQARSTVEQRRATIVFNAPNLTRQTIQAMSRAHFSEANEAGIEGIILPDRYTTYKVFLANTGTVSAQNHIVRSSPSFLELKVDIKAETAELIDFLADPVNLSSWTGHRAIHYSPKVKSWVETRSDGSGTLTNFIVDVKVKDESRVCFYWPQRNVEVIFHCVTIAPGYCSVSVSLPSTLSEGALAKTKRIISIELDLLKSILERNTHDVIPDRIHQEIHEQHLSILGVEAIKKLLPKHAAEEFGFRGNLITQGTLFEQMSTDFALTVKSQPQAVLLPTDVADVRAAVQMAKAYNIPLAARGSRISHSAGGQAQADRGLVVDMSPLSTIEIDAHGDFPIAKVGTGTYWDEVIRKTLCHGLMPPVVNDYQYLSVGGTISMGGVGFMSHRYGIQAAHVNEMEVITGEGDLLTCSKDKNTDLFDYARGGLGQCGIITSVTIPLVKAPSTICTYKLFYRASDARCFLEDVKAFVESDEIDMIHAFLKPCTNGSIGSILGSDVFAASSGDFKTVVKEGESNNGLVFFLELGCYLWGDQVRDASNSKAVKNLLLSKDGYINGEYFSEECDFQTYIRKDPPVVKTNKAHGTVPHPSFATLIDEKDVLTLLSKHLESSERGDDSTNEILIMPVKSNSNLGSGHHVPMFPMPEGSEMSFFLLFLGSVIPRGNTNSNGSEASFSSESTIMSQIRAHHRGLHALSTALGGKRYSYDTITAEVKGETAWKAHYGDTTWKRLVSAKRKFDPHHILCPGVNMWKNDNAKNRPKAIG